MRFKKITGGKENTEDEAYRKFPWLKGADFSDAVVDISNPFLVWEDGFWEGGDWKDGVWKGGFWKDGIWEDGVWRGGEMWSNERQRFVTVRGWNKEEQKFEVVE